MMLRSPVNIPAVNLGRSSFGRFVEVITSSRPATTTQIRLTGDEWVHLRLCLECGHVGCCDDSPNRHATKHFHKTKHPIMRSFEPGEDWGWCFVDQLMFEPAPRA